MKKILLISIASLGMLFNVHAQEKKMMIGLNVGLLGAGCTNCGIATGLGASFGYAVMENLVITPEINRYTDADNSSWGTVKSIITVYGVNAEYYTNEAFNGFYVAPDISYISYKVKWNGNDIWDPVTNLSVGINLGYAINIGESIAIVPHVGYGTWFENSKGRVTLGGRAAFKL